MGKGMLISEYPLKTKPLPWHFPRRNRLIAGLCDLLILVYANEKSGSIITLDFALDLGRDIFLTREMYDRLDLAGHSIKCLKDHLKSNRF
jgi:predicted Rossmann fold nucleotide-binding protein DprA/Smf involved in DNA uptake